MTQDITSLIDLSELVDDGLHEADAADVTTPFLDVVEVINNMLNGVQQFDFIKMGVATLAIASDAITLTRSYHTLTSQTGTSDNLSTISGGITGQTVILEAAATHTITIKHNVGNIKLKSAADLALTPGQRVALHYNGTDWQNADAGSGSGGSVAIKEAGSSIVATATAINFVDAINVEDGGSGQANIYVNMPFIFTGRISLTSGTYVTTTDVTGASNIYVNGPNGGTFYVSLYDGTRWNYHKSAQISLALSGLTSGKLYDVFLYNNAGTVTAELSAAWTNDTTRADALTDLDGRAVKSSATTRLWIGKIRATGTTTTEDSKLKRFVINHYNQRPRLLAVTEPATSWTVTAGTGKRKWNNTSANRVEFLMDKQCPTRLQFTALHSVSGAGGTASVDIGLDSDTVGSARIKAASNSTPSILTTAIAEYYDTPSEGYHYLQLQELELGANTTFYGDVNLPNDIQYGAQGEVWG